MRVRQPCSLSCRAARVSRHPCARMRLCTCTAAACRTHAVAAIRGASHRSAPRDEDVVLLQERLHAAAQLVIVVVQQRRQRHLQPCGVERGGGAGCCCEAAVRLGPHCSRPGGRRCRCCCCPRRRLPPLLRPAAASSSVPRPGWLHRGPRSLREARRRRSGRPRRPIALAPSVPT